MANETMERALRINERRARELITMLRKWQAKGQMDRASTRLLKMCEELSDRRELAFLAWQDGKACCFAEIAEIFERYTGVDLSSIMEKLQSAERYELKLIATPQGIIKPN